MLRGDLVGLRARHDDDLPVLHAELHDDVVTHARAEGRPWRPVTPGSKEFAFLADDTSESNLSFSVVELESGELAGAAELWKVDTHNRSAHIGITLRPSARGKGFGGDAVAVLCHYAFVVRGLHRLQIETLSDNAAMLRSAERNGFVREGVLRSSAWVMGEFMDEVLLGLLAGEWHGQPGRRPGTSALP